MKCCICKTKETGLYGHNAEPVSSGRCCNDCNYNYVIPERFKDITRERIGDE